MSILSTDKKLISCGTDYSAGSGISIIDHTISIVPSAVGEVYSAGPNISIYDVSGQPTISSKDWTQDIDQSSSGAVTESISYFNDWINGQYTEDISNVTNNLTGLSGDLSSYYKKTETSSKAEISAALDYVSAHAVGNVEVNNYVHNNSATIDEVNSAYQSNSANYLTAVNLPESATWNETSNVVSSNSAQWSQGRTYEGVSPIVVNNQENKVSADTWVLSAGDGVSLVDFSASKVTRIDCTATGDAGVNSFVTNNSASILDVNSSYSTNSGTFLTAIPSDVATTGDVADLEQTISNTYYPNTNPSSFATESWITAQGYLTAHQDISNKLDLSAFSSVSGDFLTTSFSIPESGVWNEASDVVSSNSASWSEGKTYEGISPVVVNNDENKISADTWTLSAGDGISFTDDSANKVTIIDVTAQGGDPEVQNLVRSNSSTWDSVTNKLDTTAFSTASGTFLTAVNIPESATWNEVSTAYQNASATYLTTVDLTPYQTIEGMTAYQPAGSYATTSDLEAVIEQIPTLTFHYIEV